MTKISRNIAIAIALLFAAGGTAEARTAKTAAKKAKPAQAQKAQAAKKKATASSKAKPTTSLKLSGPAAKSAVKKRRLKEGDTSPFTLQRTSVSPSGKTVHYSTVTKGSNRTGRISVRKGTKVTYRNQAPKIITQAQARKIANLHLRRERNGQNGAGTFSGINSSGLTAKGNYKFTSATDRNQFVYVNSKTGKVRNTDK